uniref:Regulatory protein zeste n=1 Tax=Acrobeloides nanus TaxID=290746 RepID=A0A914C2S9_9BILA
MADIQKRDKRVKNLDEKAAFLQKVFENRDLLFGKFTHQDRKITNKNKDEKWQEIFTECLNEGYNLVNGKTWKNLKDGTFARMKNITKEKLDKEAQSGSGSVFVGIIIVDMFSS